MQEGMGGAMPPCKFAGCCQAFYSLKAKVTRRISEPTYGIQATLTWTPANERNKRIKNAWIEHVLDIIKLKRFGRRNICTSLLGTSWYQDMPGDLARA